MWPDAPIPQGVPASLQKVDAQVAKVRMSLR